MQTVVVYDCEFLTAPGAPGRFWSGPSDPDPLCVQIGAVRLALTAPFSISESVGWYIRPENRDCRTVAVDPLLTRLTGITDTLLEQEGLPLIAALKALADFAGNDLLISWGKDDLLTLAASLFVQGRLSPIPAGRFRNATPLLLSAGEDRDTIHGLRSNTICAHFGIDSPGQAHDARDDAAAVATALQHLLSENLLQQADFHALAPLYPPERTSK